MEHNNNKKIKIKISKKQVITLAVGMFLGIIISMAIVNFPPVGGNSITGAVTFVEENFLEPQGLTGTVKSKEYKSGVYEVILEISENGEVVQEAPIYVNKGGNLLILGQAIDLNEVDSDSDYGEPELQDIPKTSIPEVELYVMSFCPFTSQAESALAPVAELLKNDIKITPRFIISINGEKVDSLRGEVEVQENYRQTCILENFQDKWWSYALYINEKCSMETIESCWKDAATSANIPIAAIEKCVEEDAFEYIKEHYELTTQKGVSGSPTVLINGVQYTGSRTPDAYKLAICSAFEIAPSACTETLSGVATVTDGSC